MIFFIYSILYLLSFVATIWFFVALFRYRKRTRLDQAVLFTFATSAFWFAADFFTLEGFFNNNLNLFFWRLSVFASFLLATLLFRTIVIKVDLKLSKFLIYISYPLFFLVAYLILFTSYIISDLRPLRFTGDSNFIVGGGFVYWGALMGVILLFSIFLVIKKIMTSRDLDEKIALKYFVSGLIFVFILVAISNILFPILNIDFPRLAFLGILSLLIITLYIIYKWGIFDFEVKSFNIRYKITITMILVALIPILAISAYFYSNTARVLEAEYLQEELRDLEIKKESIEYFLRLGREDILFLSQLSSLNNLLNREDGNSDLYKNNLKDSFLNFSKQRKIYYQIRYIDETGQEIVRVDNSGTEIFAVSEDKLQNKKGRYYFEDAIITQRGTVFVSPLDLNIEQETVEVPYKPVIRYSTPVFDVDGKIRGIIITNIDARQLLDIIDSNPNNFRQNYLINKEGYFLSHPDDNMEWGFMFDKTENNLSNVYPSIYEKIKNPNDQIDQFFCPIEDCYISYQFIYPSGKEDISSVGSNQVYTSKTTKVQGQDYYWVLFSKVDKHILDDITQAGLFYIYLIILVILIITIIFSLLLSKFISKPIDKLKESINIVTGGNLDNKVYIETKDELRDLAESFNIMISTIKQSRSEVDKKVALQTKEIRIKNQELNKKQSAVLNILEDVEAEKIKVDNLAKDLEKFKLAVDNASDHIVITDENGNCLYANKAVEKITGFSLKEVLGKKVGTKKNWGGLMSIDIYDKLWDTIKKDKNVFIGYLKNKRKDGTAYDSLSSISPILDEHGHVKFFVGIERDMTEEKNIDRAKSEFVSLASHQLRTPLATINWYAEMLLSGEMGKLNKEQKEFVSEVYNGNQRMIDLVNALLNVSRIELGKLAIDPKPTNLIDQVESVLNEIKPLLNKKQLKVNKKNW
ncbi:MAG: PAS domain S-box protein [Patescibacteria group bacterium]